MDFVAILDLLQNSLLRFINAGEFNPTCKIPRSYLNISFQVVSVIFSSANDCKNEMGFSEVSALEALANFENNRYENEVQKDVKDHVSPVSR